MELVTNEKCILFVLMLQRHRPPALSQTRLSRKPHLCRIDPSLPSVSPCMLLYFNLACVEHGYDELGCVEVIIRSPQKKNISFTLPVSNFEVKNRSLISTHNLSSLELLKKVLKSCVRSGNIRLKSLSMW